MSAKPLTCPFRVSPDAAIPPSDSALEAVVALVAAVALVAFVALVADVADVALLALVANATCREAICEAM
jgi:hypothetical protein